MIYTNQAASLARDIAVRSVIGLRKSDHVSDVIICPLIVYRQQPMKMYIVVLLLFIISTANCCFLSQYLWHICSYV